MSILDWLDDAKDFFVDLLETLWDKIKHVFLTVCRFAINVVRFFKDPSRLSKLKRNKDLLAVSIKENLNNGQVRVVNCLFNEETEEVEDYEEDALGMEAGGVDQELANAFGNKPMVILQ